MPVTFKVADVDLKPIPIKEGSFLEAVEIPGGFGRDKRPAETKRVHRASRDHVWKTTNGFVDALTCAYSQHHHIVISPDHVWLAIVRVLCQHVERNAEALRTKFVRHEGQKELHVQTGGELATYSVERVAALFQDAMAGHLVDEADSLVVPDFSTSGVLEKTVGRIMLMSAMKEYFSYKWSLCCGLPSVTLLGEADDWVRLRAKAARLAEYGLEGWLEKLLPVLDEFVLAATGSPNVEWWNRVCHHVGGGSGPRYLCGWVVAFMPFESKPTVSPWNTVYGAETSPWGYVDTNDVPSGFVRCPVTVNDNGNEMKLEFQSGFFAMNKTSTVVDGVDVEAIAPALDWRIVDA